MSYFAQNWLKVMKNAFLEIKTWNSLIMEISYYKNQTWVTCDENYKLHFYKEFQMSTVKEIIMVF